MVQNHRACYNARVLSYRMSIVGGAEVTAHVLHTLVQGGQHVNHSETCPLVVQIFKFCAIPQVMAIGTLAMCYNNHKVFTGSSLFG